MKLFLRRLSQGWFSLATEVVKTARHKQKQKQKKKKETFPFSSAFSSASASASVASENQPSVLMLCTPNNHCRPFSYHTKVMDVEYFCALSVFVCVFFHVKLIANNVCS